MRMNYKQNEEKSKKQYRNVQIKIMRCALEDILTASSVMDWQEQDDPFAPFVQ